MLVRVYANRHSHIYIELEYKLVEFSEVKSGNMLKMSSRVHSTAAITRL